MELLAHSRLDGREEKGELGKASLFPEVLPRVFVDKLNPGIVAGPERKSPGAVMFQRRRGGRERENRMEKRGITWKGQECHHEGKREHMTSWLCQIWL